ncbi:MAG TPA: TAXI family TRAP transporter solute-binding subunit [Rhodospirillaceae bacterium]|nr:TAXI family TRAP transporter solute-binding subunit [Rhodospirillaceae bacterium]
MKRIPLLMSALLLWHAVTAGSGWAADGPSRQLILGSGEVAGMFYPEAGAICRLINKDRLRHGLHCLVEPTGGSMANLAALQAGDLQLAIVQSRILGQAVGGSGAFVKAPLPGLRALLSLHAETVLVMLAPSSRIKTVAELKGKRVNLGQPGSFQRGMGEALLGAAGLAATDLGAVLEIEPDRVVKALCRNEVDAAVFSGLNPISEVQDAIDDCGARILSLKDGVMDSLLKSNPAYVRQLISEDIYPGLPENIVTIGLRAVLVTTDQLSGDAGYAVVRAIFENLPAFKAMHPMLETLNKKQMSRDALVAPLHEGAQRYFRENGLP